MVHLTRTIYISNISCDLNYQNMYSWFDIHVLKSGPYSSRSRRFQSSCIVEPALFIPTRRSNADNDLLANHRNPIPASASWRTVESTRSSDDACTNFQSIQHTTLHTYTNIEFWRIIAEHMYFYFRYPREFLGQGSLIIRAMDSIIGYRIWT